MACGGMEGLFLPRYWDLAGLPAGALALVFRGRCLFSATIVLL
jgi:hypothetical protein